MAIYFAGAFFTVLPGKDFCEKNGVEQKEILNQALFIMALVSVGLLVVFNLFFFKKTHVTIIKGFNWFVNSVISAATVMYHFPMAYLQIVFIYPLILNAVPIFGWGRAEKLGPVQKGISLISFVAVFGLSFILLFGSMMENHTIEVS